MGSSGSELARVSSTLDEELDDVLLGVAPDAVWLFAPASAWRLVERQLALWPNLTVVTLSGEELEDTDLAEERKVDAFARMTEGRRRVGVPLPGFPADTPMTGDSPVEKWPIVQAYAFEDMGNGATRGFFTMNHRVVSVAEQLAAGCYSQVDSHSLKLLQLRSLPLLRYHWESTIRMLDLPTGEERAFVTETAVAEPLGTYFNYGRLDSVAASEQQPRVLFGQRSNELDGMSGETRLGQAGPYAGEFSQESEGNNQATHLTVEAREPHGVLWCARSYLCHIGSGINGPDPYQAFAAQNTQRLAVLYAGLLECLTVVCSEVASDPAADHGQIKQLALDWLVEREPEQMSRLVLPEAFELSFQSASTPTRLVADSLPLAGCSSLRAVHWVQLTLLSIPSADPSCDTPLGALTVGDSVMFNLLASSPELRVLNITRPAISAWAAWTGSGAEAVHCRHTATELTRDHAGLAVGDRALGDVLVPAVEGASWKLDGAMLQGAMSGSVHLYERGLVLQHKRLGYAVLHLEELESVRVLQGQGNDARRWAVQMKLPLEADPVFGTVGSRDVTVWLPQAQSKTVVPAWKQTLAMLSRELLAGPEAAEEQLGEPALACMQDWVQEMACTDLLAIPEQAIEANMGPWELEQAKPEEDRIPITVLCGVSGSGKSVIAESIANVTESSFEWEVVRNKLADGAAWHSQRVCDQLVAFAEKSHAMQRARLPRVMVITPGNASMAVVMHTLCSSPEISQRFYVSSVTCVLNMSQLAQYRDTWGTALPNMKEQVYGGWSQCAIVSQHENVDQEFVELQEEQLRQLRCGIVVMRATNGRVLAQHEREQVLSDCWLQPEMQRARMRACPGWLSGRLQMETARSQAVQGVFVSMGPQPDKERFVKWIASAVQDGKLGNILRVIGFLKLDGDNKDWSAFESIGASTRWVSPKLKLEGAFAQPVHTDTKILFVGENLSQSSILDGLASTRPPMREKLVIKTTESLSSDEVKQVNKDRQTEQCPEGIYFTGVHWVNFYGEPVFEHPLLPQFLEEYVAEQNHQANAHNAEVQAEWDADAALMAQSFVLVDAVKL